MSYTMRNTIMWPWCLLRYVISIRKTSVCEYWMRLSAISIMWYVDKFLFSIIWCLYCIWNCVRSLRNSIPRASSRWRKLRWLAGLTWRPVAWISLELKVLIHRTPSGTHRFCPMVVAPIITATLQIIKCSQVPFNLSILGLSNPLKYS